MSKINQFSATEKLAILQEFEKGRIPIMEIAKKYDISKSTLRIWRHLYELNGYRGLETITK